MKLGIGFLIFMAAVVLILSMLNLLQLSPVMLFLASFGVIMILALVVMLVMGKKHKRD